MRTKTKVTPGTYAEWAKCKTTKQKIAFIEKRLKEFEDYMDDDERHDAEDALAFACAASRVLPWLIEQAWKYEGLCK
jgi:hypothetical protein